MEKAIPYESEHEAQNLQKHKEANSQFGGKPLKLVGKYRSLQVESWTDTPLC